MIFPNQKVNADLMTASSEVVGRSLWDDALVRLKRNKLAMASLIILGVMVFLAIFVPILSPHGFDEVTFTCEAILHPPTLDGFYPFGTDGSGRDLLTRTFYGARISLAVGLIATAVALSIGVIYGAVAGFFGGVVDNAMMRVVDVLYAIPFMFFVIILMVVFGKNFVLLFLAIGAVEWLTMARIVRGQTLSIRRKEFIEAAEAIGLSRWQIIRRHVIPNVIGPVIVYVTLTIPAVIMAESFLSFLGLGIQEPLTSWGVLISEGKDELETAPWMLIFPAVLMAVTLFCFNFLGDGLRDALDPKDR